MVLQRRRDDARHHGSSTPKRGDEGRWTTPPTVIEVAAGGEEAGQFIPPFAPGQGQPPAKWAGAAETVFMRREER